MYVFLNSNLNLWTKTMQCIVFFVEYINVFYVIITMLGMINMNKIEEFEEVIGPLLCNQHVQNMHTMTQHVAIASLLEHLVYSAYITFCICKKFRLNMNEAVVASLLHDFRLQDSSEFRKPFTHSTLSKQAAYKYFDLNDKQLNMIEAHMWPLTITLIPKSKEAFVVASADRFATIVEVLHLYKKTKTTKCLSAMIQKYVA